MRERTWKKLGYFRRYVNAVFGRLPHSSALAIGGPRQDVERLPPKAHHRARNWPATLSQENGGTPLTLSANGDGFEFLKNAVYEVLMVCRAQGRRLRRDNSQIGCDLARVAGKLAPLRVKETSQLFNAIRELFVLGERGALVAA